MNIKAQGLLNGAKWIRETYGEAALGEVLRACSPAVQERCASAIGINWHPAEEYVEFLRAADRLLGKSDGAIAVEIGAVAARANLRGVTVRLAFYIAKPEFLIRRITGLWRQFNDEGQMHLSHFEPAHIVIEVTGITQPSWLFCSACTGWCRELATAAGMPAPNARQVECRDRGGAKCIWEVRAGAGR